MKKIIYTLSALSIFILLFDQVGFAEIQVNSFLPQLNAKDSRILKQPNGPFAVMLFDEDALGLNIGVIYYGVMSVPVDGNWWLSERFWSDRVWSTDVTNVLWDITGDYLYISTSRVYGDGGVFKLNLKKKNVERVYPKGDIKNTQILWTEIIAFDQKQRKFTAKITYENNNNTESVEIPMN